MTADELKELLEPTNIEDLWKGELETPSQELFRIAGEHLQAEGNSSDG